MPKFRKKPVEIEAFQMTKEHRQDNSEWPEWLHLAWNKEYAEEGSINPSDYPNSKGDDRLLVQTKEGPLIIDWGDWIIQGIEGQIYPCKPDIFEQTYEKVEE